MSKEALDRKLEALAGLRSLPDSAERLEQLRKALKDRNNYLVSKAARMIPEFQYVQLIPDLLAAFDHFFSDPVRSDPQCWAKEAIVKALKDLGYRDSQPFLRGLAHFQPEPSWGKPVDSAATLRGACALALIDCELGGIDILSHLTDRLADPEKRVRIDTTVAIGQLGMAEGALLLRLKARVGDSDPEVIGQIFCSILDLDEQGPAFVAEFLDSDEEAVRSEAIGALAQSREPAALEALKSFWQERLSLDTRRCILALLAACPLQEGAEFLFPIFENETGELAAIALRSLGGSRFHQDMRERVQQLVGRKNELALASIFEQGFPKAG